MSDYPQSVVEVLDDRMTFKPAAFRAVRAFAKARPWSGSVEERKQKFRRLHHDLAEAYGIREPALGFGSLDGSGSGDSCYLPALHRIVLIGRLSVLTYLHEFAHARGMEERAACKWSINLFRRCFPRQYGKLIHVGHMLIRPADVGSAAGETTA